MREEYTFLLKQHIGNPSKAIVKENEIVKRGQMIALQQGLGANIFSSINGVVKEVTAQAITIAKENTDFSKYEPLKSIDSLEKIIEAGIVGLGGAGFPTGEKLKTKLSDQGTCIINAVECEPLLGHNIARINKQPENLIKALYLIMDILKISNGVIAIKEKHTTAIEKLRKVLESYEPKTGGKKKIELVLLEDMYPMGEERAILREVKGQLLSPTQLPKDADCVVINAETAFKMKEAVIDNKPFLDKDMTIAGKRIKNATEYIYFDVPIGRSVSKVLEESGGIADSFGELIMGGPFTGHRTTCFDVIQKTTGGILATECFLKGPEKIGLLVCACGATKERMEEIAASMGSKVCQVEYCKQAILVNQSYKCENPGRCPGQVQKILAIKKAGADGVLIGNCSDCSNTVMSCAPKLGLLVYHVTDHALRAMNHKIIRRLQRED